ncbi:hypothetical protein SBRCBS47491_002214 [Sporothrix bragantina]|uniref:Thioester reductase (TE) domain-containing protein n=1 Tax=Sporothrix bragantina TaxID=671064 RepID=A0ABP0B5S1_9PEZI
MAVITATPDYGRRLLLNVIDEAAATDPNHIVYSFKKTDDPDDGFHRVSNRRYAKGVNRLAWLIEDGHGKPAADIIPSIGYIGPRSLHDIFSQILNTKDAATTLGDDDDLFLAGLDSLSATRAISSLRSSLVEKSGNVDSSISLIPLRFIYANSTIDKLNVAMDNLVRPAQKSVPRWHEMTDAEIMQQLLDELTHDLPQRSASEPSSHDLSCVLLTGGTGSLGPYLLDTLLANPSVQRIYCLNRSADARQRHLAEAKTRGLTQDLSSPRVEFFHADLSKPLLGLSQQTHNDLLQNTTTILHNQWPVSFYRPTAAYAPIIRGVRHLIDLAVASKHQPVLFFVSSVGVVQAQTSNSTVPEAFVTRLEYAEGGYGQSKLVAELLLAKAAETSGLNLRIFRLGQLAGPVDGPLGQWKKKEWLPLIVASSKYLEELPSTLASLDRVDWLPVDRAARIMVELMAPSGAGIPDALVYHVVNPHTVSWSSLVPTVAAGLGLNLETDVVPWEDWVGSLWASQFGGDDERNPAVSLQSFYQRLSEAAKAGRQLPILETTISQQRSPTLRSMEAISPAWMTAWMKQWAF